MITIHVWRDEETLRDMQEVTFVCDLCDTQATTPTNALPPGWAFVVIATLPRLLCEACATKTGRRLSERTTIPEEEFQ